MKLRNILLILAAITLGFASCSSESDILSEIDTPVNGLDEETVAVSFNLGNDLQTKAGNGTQDASDDEATIHNCVIAIFDHATGTMLAKREFILNDGLNRKGNAYITNNIETKAIPSDVIVVANCPVGFFNNVVTKEGFDKVVQAQMNDINTLTASNLIKVWESEEEPQYANGIDLKDPSQRNISVNVRQIAARVDLDLRVINMAKTALDEKTFLSIHSVTMTNINTQTKLFTENGIDAQYLESYTKGEGKLFNNQKSISIAPSVESENIYTPTVTFYTYEKLSNTLDSELTIEAYLVVKGQNNQESLKKIVIKGEGNGLMKRGNLYKILGTIDYQKEKVTFDCDYEVVDWNKVTVDVPSFN